MDLDPSSRKDWRAVLAVYGAFLLYVLTSPPGGLEVLVAVLRHPVKLTGLESLTAPLSLSDVVVNMVGYGLFGVLAVQAFRPMEPGARVGGATVAGASLSILVESLQQYLPGRTASLQDVAVDLAAVFLGALAAWRAGETLDRGLARWITSPSGIGRAAVVYLVALAAVLLWPFDLRTAPDEIWHGLQLVEWNPFHGWRREGSLAHDAKSLLLFLPLGFLLGRRGALRGAVRHCLAVGLIAAAWLEATQLFTHSHVVTARQVLQGALGVAIGGLPFFSRRPRRPDPLG